MTAIAEAGMGQLPKIADLLEELSHKNHVTVTVYRAVTKRGANRIRRRVLHEQSHESVAQWPMLAMHDKLRMLKGDKPIWLGEAVRRLGGELRSVTPNLRTNVGIDFCATQLGSTAPTTQADYIALSNNTNAPAATDTSNVIPWNTAVATDGAAGSGRGEYTGLGLTRKQATYAHTTSATSYSQTATWTASGTVTSVQLAGMFGGSTRTAQSTNATNILFLENTFTATSLVTNDQISLAWTVNI
jgi:hypothetical protein